jgi:hypothetical protein
MSAPEEPAVHPGPDYERLAAEHAALARGLQCKDVLNTRLLELGDLRYNMAHSQAILEQERLQREAEEVGRPGRTTWRGLSVTTSRLEQPAGNNQPM